MPTGLAPASKGNGMNKGKIARLVGFVGALGISAALVASAVSSTGAYFTASQSGTISGSGGAITIAANTSTNLTFDKLIPGVYQDKTVQYTVGGDTAVDTWLVFTDDAAYCQFSGSKDDPACTGGGLGRFGHFAVSGDASNLLFSSYNLAGATGTAPYAAVSECANPDGYGAAGPATSSGDTGHRCGVPLAIKLESGLGSGSTKQVTLTFGLTPRAGNDHQVSPAPPATVGFKIVATQPGIAPNQQGF